MIPLKDSHPSHRFPIVVVGLIVVNILVFLWETGNPEAIISRYAIVPSRIATEGVSVWLTFITSQFLHGGIVHLAMNMLFLWVFGDNVEDRFGIAFLPFYLVGGVAGGVLQYLIDPTSSIPILGASGAIAGVLGAYLIFFPRHSITTLVPSFGFMTSVEIPAMFMLGYWFVLQIFSGAGSLVSGVSGGVAYMAHVGGFVLGWAIARIQKKQ